MDGWRPPCAWRHAARRATVRGDSGGRHADQERRHLRFSDSDRAPRDAAAQRAGSRRDARLLEAGPDVELGFHFARFGWGRGYATEAAGTCLEVAFSALGMERVVAVVAPGNAASVRVLEKIGMRAAGRRRLFGGIYEVYDATRPAAGPDSIRFRAR